MIAVWVAALGMIAWLALGLVVGMLAGRLLRGRQVHYPTRRQYLPAVHVRRPVDPVRVCHGDAPEVGGW